MSGEESVFGLPHLDPHTRILNPELPLLLSSSKAPRDPWNSRTLVGLFRALLGLERDFRVTAE